MLYPISAKQVKFSLPLKYLWLIVLASTFLFITSCSDNPTKGEVTEPDLSTADISISEINSPDSVTVGDVIEFNIVVENTGEAGATDSINVTLTNDNDATIVDTQIINQLNADSQSTLTFTWNTEDAESGEYSFTATHDFEDENTENDELSDIIVIQEPESPTNTLVSIPAIDNQIVEFMTDMEVNGMSIAITRYGKLVYAKGYGYADVEGGVWTDTTHLFRIASLSKFVTAAGIMKLIEEGSLDMEDKVFGDGAVLGTDFGQAPYSEYVSNIKIRHLLHHESGGWGNSGSDPAFSATALNVNELISWVIDNKPLEKEPGTDYIYSNIGYQILGRVIEQISGQSYEDFIREHILEPAGVKNMQLGVGSLQGRKPNEVRYYAPPGWSAYETSGTINRLNSAGAWIASPIDLTRILVHIDGFNTVPDILDPATIKLMSTPSPISGYASGFNINSSSKNWWHSGSLGGSRAWVVRGSSGYNWVILTNTGSSKSDFNTRMNDLIWPAVRNSSTPWTDEDLF